MYSYVTYCEGPPLLAVRRHVWQDKATKEYYLDVTQPQRYRIEKQPQCTLLHDQATPAGVIHANFPIPYGFSGHTSVSEHASNAIDYEYKTSYELDHLTEKARKLTAEELSAQKVVLDNDTYSFDIFNVGRS